MLSDLESIDLNSHFAADVRELNAESGRLPFVVRCSVRQSCRPVPAELRAIAVRNK